jgi:hypothetical protein
MSLTPRQQQLRERDVRKLAPALDPNNFMRMYIESNFPQTVALPSQQQLSVGLGNIKAEDPLKLAKKPLSGTKYDNPGGV